MKTAACVVVKNECESIVEWIAAHMVCGFDTIIVLDDGSTDGTYELVQRVGQHYDVRLMCWPRDTTCVLQAGGLQQAHAMEVVCRMFAREFDWIAFLDSDEYLVPRNSDETLTGMLAAHDRYDAVLVPWLIFGSSGHEHVVADRLVTETFVRRARFDFDVNAHVKSIVRPGAVMHCINPHAFRVRGEQIVFDGSPVVWRDDDSPGILRETIDGPAWAVHHYFVRSREHWRRRLARRQISGSVRSDADFAYHDRNDVLDTTAVQRCATRIESFRLLLDHQPVRNRVLAHGSHLAMA